MRVNITFAMVVGLASVVSVAASRDSKQQDSYPSGKPYLQTVWTTEKGLPQNSINAIVQTRDGYLWLATYGGLVRFDGNRFTVFDTSNAPGLAGNRIIALYEDRAGALWIGTQDGGMSRYTQGTFAKYTTADGLPSLAVRSFCEDREGTLWVATNNGLVRFQAGRITRYGPQDGLSHHDLTVVITDRTGALWIGTYGGGLNRFKHGRFTPITRENGLPENIVSRILEDDSGNLWMTGNRGIYRVSRKMLNEFADGRRRVVEAVSYGVADGMKSAECNGGGQPAGWKATDTMTGDTSEFSACAQPPGTIAIVTSSVPKDAQDFSFTGSGPNGFTFGGGFSLDDDSDAGLPNSRTFTDLPSGSYSLTEAAVTGWRLTSLNCTGGTTTVNLTTRSVTINLGPAETITCTFTNTKLGTITITKDAVPDDAQDFSFSGSLGNFSLDDDTNATLPKTRTFADLLPGTYAVTEATVTGWLLTDLSCADPSGGTSVAVNTRTATIGLAAGESVTCTFTNTKLGTITINKSAVGGNDTFGFTVNGPTSATPSITTSGGSGSTSVSVVPGSYTVTETVPSGWDQTSASCTGSFTVSPGGSVTCTFTNTKRGTIIVKKVTTPNPDPTNTSFTFTGDAAGTITNGQMITVGNLIPGTYTSTESVPGNFELTAIACDDGASATRSAGTIGTATATFKLDPGETVTCTFTNRLKRADLRATKSDSPDPAVAGQTLTYTVTVNNSGPDPAVNAQLSDVVPVGATFQSIAAPSGWSCSTPPVGGTGAIICTRPNMAVSSTSATFTLVVRIAPEMPESATLTNTATLSSATFDPDPGSNTATATTRVMARADVAIIKGGPAEAPAGTPITYTIEVVNNGPSHAAAVVVSEAVPLDVTFVGASGDGWMCHRAAGLLTCTRSSLGVGRAPAITVMLRAPTMGEAIRNTATVSSTTTDPNSANNSSSVETRLTKASLTAMAFAFRPEKSQEAEKRGVLVADSSKNLVRVLLSQGDGTFKSGQTVSVGDGPVALAVGDFNRDGVNDVVVVNRDSNTLSVLEGEGDGTFKRRVKTTVVGAKPNAVVVGDFDGDGRLDLMVAYPRDSAVQLLKGRGEGTFGAGRIYGVGKTPSALAAADFNQDGRLDVAAANSDSDSVTVLLGGGDGTFSSGGEFTVGSGPIALAVADFDGDGRVELATANFKSNDLTILKNTSEPGSNRTQRFRITKTLAAGEGPMALVAGRFLGESLGMALTNLLSGELWVYLETGNGALRTVQRYTVMGLPAGLALGDYNGDGRLDLVALDATGSSMHVLLGTGGGKFTLKP